MAHVPQAIGGGVYPGRAALATAGAVAVTAPTAARVETTARTRASANLLTFIREPPNRRSHGRHWPRSSLAPDLVQRRISSGAGHGRADSAVQARELLLDHTRVELGEHRGRLPDRR